MFLAVYPFLRSSRVGL
uniref:Uncharacterized protein n=1 Tax=Anguilla anguilla TaxID=7936 RepID=A0A0E9TL61_ANGAN